MEKKQYYSTTEAAKLLGVSRVAIFKWIKNSKISAQKIGRNYAIPAQEIRALTNARELSAAEKKMIDAAVKKAVKEYGETLKLLANA